MNFGQCNESFSKLYEDVIANQDVKNDEKTELANLLHAKVDEYMIQGKSNIKDYEYALQEVIENFVPDKSWWEVTSLNIFWDLFEHRDPDGTVERIIDNLLDDAFKPTELKELAEVEINDDFDDLEEAKVLKEFKIPVPDSSMPNSPVISESKEDKRAKIERKLGLKK